MASSLQLTTIVVDLCSQYLAWRWGLGMNPTELDGGESLTTRACNGLLYCTVLSLQVRCLLLLVLTLMLPSSSRWGLTLWHS